MFRRFLLAIAIIMGIILGLANSASAQDAVGVCPDKYPIEDYRPTSESLPDELPSKSFWRGPTLGPDDEHPNTVLICTKKGASLDAHLENGDLRGVIAIGAVAIAAVFAGVICFFLHKPRDSDFNRG